MPDNLVEAMNQPRYTENELRVHISQAVAAAVERERERADLDAKRYRWLRDKATQHWLAEGAITDDDVDEAINLAAIRGITTDAASG